MIRNTFVWQQLVHIRELGVFIRCVPNYNNYLSKLAFDKNKNGYIIYVTGVTITAQN